MTQSEREFVAQIFAGSVPGATAAAKGVLTPPVWFAALALGVLTLGAVLGFAV